MIDASCKIVQFFGRERESDDLLWWDSLIDIPVLSLGMGSVAVAVISILIDERLVAGLMSSEEIEEDSVCNINFDNRSNYIVGKTKESCHLVQPGFFFLVFICAPEEG